MKYALYNNDTGKLVKKARRLPTKDGNIPADLDPSLAWLEVENAPRPDYDPNTHRLQKAESKDGDKWVIGWQVVELSIPQQIAALKSRLTQDQTTDFKGRRIPIDKASLAFYESVRANLDGITLPMYLPLPDGSVLKVETKQEALLLHATAKGDANGLNHVVGQAIDALEAQIAPGDLP